MIRNLIEKTTNHQTIGFIKKKKFRSFKKSKRNSWYYSKKRDKQYNMIDIIERLVDESNFLEYKKDFGKTIICGYARIDGWEVGIVANQRTIVKNGKGEMQIGGVIYSDSADKSDKIYNEL